MLSRLSFGSFEYNKPRAFQLMLMMTPAMVAAYESNMEF